jgi:predicted site-specific integrase-resolvase
MLIYIKWVETTMSSKGMRLREVAETVGVSAITLRRWLLSGKVPEVTRDRNGWRLFTARDIGRIRQFANSTKLPRK